MKELDPFALLAILNEALGPLGWLPLPALLLTWLAYRMLLQREGGLLTGRLYASRALGVLGGFIGTLVVVRLTDSTVTSPNTAVDWVLMALIFVVGTVITSLVSYTLMGLFWGGQPVRRRRPSPHLHRRRKPVSIAQRSRTPVIDVAALGDEDVDPRQAAAARTSRRDGRDPGHRIPPVIAH